MNTPLTDPAPTSILTYTYIFLPLDPFMYSYSDTRTVTLESPRLRIAFQTQFCASLRQF